MSSNTQKANMAATLSEVLDAMRVATSHLELPVQHILSFLDVAARQGSPCRVKDLELCTGLSRASASRVVATLGRGMPGRKGFNLVETSEDPNNRTVKLVTLTAKGHEVMDTVSEILRRASLDWLIPEPLRPYLNLDGVQVEQQ